MLFIIYVMLCLCECNAFSSCSQNYENVYTVGIPGVHRFSAYLASFLGVCKERKSTINEAHRCHTTITFTCWKQGTQHKYADYSQASKLCFTVTAKSYRQLVINFSLPQHHAILNAPSLTMWLQVIGGHIACGPEHRQLHRAVLLENLFNSEAV